MLLKFSFHNFKKFISIIIIFVFILLSVLLLNPKVNRSFSSNDFPYGVCPPFFLLDKEDVGFSATVIIQMLMERK